MTRAGDSVSGWADQGHVRKVCDAIGAPPKNADDWLSKEFEAEFDKLLEMLRPYMKGERN